MRKFKIISTILVLLFWVDMAVSAMTQVSIDKTLENYKWKNRLVFIFATDENNQKYQNIQAQLEKNKRDLTERDIIVFKVFRDKVIYQNNQLNKKAADDLRKRYSIDLSDFNLVLVGKDGTEKMKDNQANLSEIFPLIDSMPMRKNELNQ